MRGGRKESVGRNRKEKKSNKDKFREKLKRESNAIKSIRNKNINC